MMLTATTPTVESVPVKQYIGMVSDEVISGINMLRDFGASLSSTSGDHAPQHEEETGDISTTAVNEICARAQAIGASAVVGTKVSYFTVDANSGTFAAIAAGAVVTL